MDQTLYNELNKAWKSTCKIVLGDEIGELKEYEGWLSEYLTTNGKAKSHISGKDVTLASADYCKKARFVSMDEIKELSSPLDINRIKDMDSVLEAISERWEYSGDRVLGNSSNTEDADFVVDSQSVYKGIDVRSSQYVCNASNVEKSKYVFGTMGYFAGEFAIASLKQTRSKRTIGCHLILDSSDTYFCSFLNGCHDVMFSFSQRNKKNMIGNLELPRDKYSGLKKNLLSEMREEIKKNKRFPSLLEFVPKIAPNTEIHAKPSELKSKRDMEPIERAFSSTSKVLFKKEFSDLLGHEEWLSRHAYINDAVKSPFGAEVLVPPLNGPIDSMVLNQNLYSVEEAEAASGLKLDEKDIGSLSRIREKIAEIGYITTEFEGGKNSNVIKCPIMFDDQNVYNVGRALSSENMGIGYLISGSKYIFGANIVSFSEFCMKCYYSTHLNRCFEVDSSSDCSDSYFCHNSEGLRECMFCFNVKSKRYAIGNTQLQPDQYRRIKDALVSQMADEIIQNKELKWDIYNIGCAKP